MGKRKIKPIEGEQLSLFNVRFQQGEQVTCPQGNGRVYHDDGGDSPVWVTLKNTAIPFPRRDVRRVD